MFRTLLFFMFSFTVYAQDFSETKVFTEEATDEEERTSGQRLKITSGANIIENKNVVGQNDGKTNIYSFKLNYETLALAPQSEIEFKVKLTETLSQTPTINRLLKTDDEFAILSTYKRYLKNISWLGAFARFELQTPVMDGYDTRSEAQDYVITRRNGDLDTETTDRLKLNDGFNPLVTKESFGATAKALNTKAAQLDLRTGFGAKQIAAKDSLLIKDDEDTATIIEVIELDNITMAGLEAGLEFSGLYAAFEYRIFAEALYPLSYSPKNDSDPEASELVSTEAGVDLSYALESWLALSYKLSSKRDPLLSDKAQITQNFLLALTFAFDSRNTKE